MRAAWLVVLAACKASAPGVVDLAGSLEPVQRELDAHAGEARFLTLLSPT